MNDFEVNSYAPSRGAHSVRSFHSMDSAHTTIAATQRLYSGPVCRDDITGWKGANPWSTRCWMAPCNTPLYCISAQVCFPVRLWQQRKALLDRRGEKYVCCAGLCGTQCTDFWFQPYTPGNDDVALGCEICCCPCFAMMGNRLMVMQHYNLENDMCVDSLQNKLSCPLTICTFFYQDDVIENLVYLSTFPFCMGCILAQQQNHMDVFGYPVGRNVTATRMK